MRTDTKLFTAEITELDEEKAFHVCRVRNGVLGRDFVLSPLLPVSSVAFLSCPLLNIDRQSERLNAGP